MKIATYHINGVKARPAAAGGLARGEARPDVAVLHEIKSVDETLTRARSSSNRGYNLETHGQKGFNGVAIHCRAYPLEDVSRGLPGDGDDIQARWIEAFVTGERASVRVCGL